MPNQNAYAVISLSIHQRPRDLDVIDSEDRELILMAAQLCRIILRALEIRGFRDLQKELGDFTRREIPDIESAVLRTGRLLGTLRWRLAWWQLVDNGSAGLDFSARVKKITQVLYFWFLFAKRRLPEENQSLFPNGAWSHYAETGRTWDDFPQEESFEGFRTWIFGAHSLIKNSRPLAAMAATSGEQPIKQAFQPMVEQSIVPKNPAMQQLLHGWQLPMGPRKNSYYDPETNMTWEF